MAGRLFLSGFGGCARVDEILGHATVCQEYPMARNALAIEGCTELQRMINIVGNADVLAEDLLAHAVVKAGTLIVDGGGGEIVEEEPDEVEDGGGFKNHGVAAGR